MTRHSETGRILTTRAGSRLLGDEGDHPPLTPQCSPIKSIWTNCHLGQAPRSDVGGTHCLIHLARVSSFLPRRGVPLREHSNLYLPSSQLLPYFVPLNHLTSYGKFKLERGRAHHSRGPNSFYPGQDTLHVRWV